VITSEGLNLALNVLFGAVAKPTTWYVGFISATSYTGVSGSDTMASHAGWTEYTDYAEASRPTLTFGAASGAEIGNPTAVEITPNADAEVIGFFLTTNATKGGTTGYLFAPSVFDEGTRSVQTGVIEQFVASVSSTNSSST